MSEPNGDPDFNKSRNLEKIQTRHQGMTKCQQTVKDSVWWPGIKKDIDKNLSKCSTCCKMEVQHSEPLILSPFTQRPCQSGNWPVWVEENRLSSSCRLLLTIHRNCQTDIDYSSECNITSQIHLCLSWDTWNCCIWQWSTILISCIWSILKRVQIWSCD